MFTSRAEYRLSLRADNADLRLTRKGFEAGVVSLQRLLCLDQREGLVHDGLARLSAFRLPVARWEGLDESGSIAFSSSGDPKAGLRSKTGHDVLSMPNVELAAVESVMRRVTAERAEAEQQQQEEEEEQQQ